MKVAGIDYSTKAVDIVLVDQYSREPTWFHYDLFGRDAFDRTRDVGAKLTGKWKPQWEDVLSVGIEEPMQRGPAAVRFVPALKAVQGAVLACLPAHLAVAPIGATQWKKAVGLGGNASKDQVAVWAQNEIDLDVHWGDRGLWTQDAFDAYAIARAVLERTRVLAA